MRAQLAQHRNPVTHALICFKRHTRKGAGSVATTRSSPEARRGDAKAMRAQLGDDRNPDTLRHTHLRHTPHSQECDAVARLPQRQARQARRGDACTARDDRNPDTLSPLSATLAGASAQPPPTQERSEPCHTHFLQASHSQKASAGSVAATSSTTRLSKRCVHSSASIGTQ